MSHSLHIRRRILIISILLLSYLSGIGELNKINNPLFLNNEVSARGIKNSSFLRSQILHATPSSQIKELKIGWQKSIPQSGIHDSLKEWGVAKQIDEHTWTMQVGQDKKMATANEILLALNTYRQQNNKGTLVWNNTLADYAQTRASYFVSQGKLDSHAGFADYLKNQDGFHKLGFAGLGENSSIGYALEGVHLIEWVYAGDKPHNDNQLSREWSYVGIGVLGNATDLIFGGEKL